MSIRVEVSNLLDLKKVSTILWKLLSKKEGGIVFLRGELGAGKTTFVRMFVENLPGGCNAEVSSPSFNLYNIYPTRPEVIHIDLYRCVDLEEEVLEYLSREDVWVFVEWCDRLPEFCWPLNYILICFLFLEDKRIMDIEIKGFKYQFIEEELEKKFKEQGLS